MVYLIKAYRFFLLSLCILLLQACGGSEDEDTTTKHTISADTTVVSFSHEQLTSSNEHLAINVRFQGNGLLIGYSPESTPVNWLSFRTENVTSNSATVYIDLVNAEFQLSNLHNATVRLSTGDLDTNELVHHDIDVSLLVWQLLSFNETLGFDDIAGQNFKIDNPNDDLTFSADVDWLTLGSVLEDGISTVTVTTQAGNFSQAGLHQGNVVISSKTGDSVIPVQLALDKLYLFADQENIAFSSTANDDVVSQVISLNSNSPSITQWQATTDADWLILTPNYVTNLLKIRAFPNIAPPNTLSSATITISALGLNSAESQELLISNETIKVSLYNSDTVAEAQSVSNITPNENGLISAPLLPSIYVANKNTLQIYHQYTAALLVELAIAPAGSLLEQLIVHPNGETLLAQADETIINEDLSESIITHRYKINLADINNISFEENTSFDIQFKPLKFVRFSGRYFVITQALEFADEDLNTRYWDQENAYAVKAIDVAKQAQSLFILNNTDSSLNRYKINVNDFSTNTVIAERTHQYRPESLSNTQAVNDFVISSDEENIYLISPTSEWLTFEKDPSDGINFVDKGLLNTRDGIVSIGLFKNNNDQPYFSSFDPSLGFTVNIYDQQQSLATTVFTGEQLPSNMKLSSDQQRLFMHIPSSNSIELMNIEAYVNPIE
jgi:hypothetical protein